MARRRARELAFRTLFQAERGGAPVLDVWAQVALEQRAALQQGGDAEGYEDALDPEGLVFAERLVRAFAEHKAEIDGRLEQVIRGWSFSQMAQTDLNVLRLALTEFLFEPDVPKEVTIEMAIRIAKKYGGEESGRFVNGVLAELYQSLATP